MKLDAIDKRLLNMLQDNAKWSVKDMAAALHMTKTPIYERIRRFEKDGVIEKYVAVLDREKLSNSMIIFCSVTLENQKLKQLEAFSDAIVSIPEVMECYLMGGANDFLLKVVVEDLKDYHRFSSGILAALPNVDTIKSTFVLNEVKRSSIYPV